MNRVVIICALTLIGTMACRKPDIVDETTFVDSYARILVIKSSTADSATAATKMQDVFTANHVTLDQLQEQLKRYAEDGKRYGVILEKINVRIRSIDSAAHAK